jgi:glycosyltransferase involved in cell wall biosynthesis
MSTRVAYLIETAGRGGAEVALTHLVRHLDRDRYAVVAGVGGAGWLADELRALGADVHFLPAADGTVFSWRTAQALLRLLRAQRPDVLHTFLFQMNAYGSLAGRLLGIPVVTSIRSKHYELARKHRLLAWQLMARLSDRVTANSADLRDTFCRHARVPRHRVTVIPNGVDAQRFGGAQRRAAIRQQLDIPPTAPVIGAVGRTHPVKGHRFLVEAMARIAPRWPQARLLLVGDKVEPEFTALARIVSARGLGERVIFTGARDDVADLLGAMDVFALPSLSEGMSNALLEAMAAGLPVVATAVGGNPEVLAHGELGVLVPPGAPGELADAIAGILRDYSVARALGERARAYVAQWYDWRQMANRYSLLYDEVCRRHAAPEERTRNRARLPTEVAERAARP